MAWPCGVGSAGSCRVLQGWLGQRELHGPGWGWGEMFEWGARDVAAENRMQRFGRKDAGAGGRMHSGGEAGGRVGVGREDWKAWRVNSSAARDELCAGLWGEQVGERGEDLGWRMLKRIWGLYHQVPVDTGVGTGGAAGGEAGDG